VAEAHARQGHAAAAVELVVAVGAVAAAGIGARENDNV
jgi:hypothetical protein